MPPVGVPSQTGGAECLHCGRIFQPRRRGHVFCSTFCRHRGQRPPEERGEIDSEAVKRLFDPDPDANERIRDDDWFPSPADAEWRSLYAHETVETRRRGFMNLMMAGEL
jgi:hypothetical protein